MCGQYSFICCSRSCFSVQTQCSLIPQISFTSLMVLMSALYICGITYIAAYINSSCYANKSNHKKVKISRLPPCLLCTSKKKEITVFSWMGWQKVYIVSLVQMAISVWNLQKKTWTSFLLKWHYSTEGLIYILHILQIFY